MGPDVIVANLKFSGDGNKVSSFFVGVRQRRISYGLKKTTASGRFYLHLGVFVWGYRGTKHSAPKSYGLCMDRPTHYYAARSGRSEFNGYKWSNPYGSGTKHCRSCGAGRRK